MTYRRYAHLHCPKCQVGLVSCEYRYDPSAFGTGPEFAIAKHAACTVCEAHVFTTIEREAMTSQLELEHSYVDFGTAFEPQGMR